MVIPPFESCALHQRVSLHPTTEMTNSPLSGYGGVDRAYNDSDMDEMSFVILSSS